MALAKQDVSVAFTKGLDLKTDPKLVIQGKMSRLENMVFDGGTLVKRLGNVALPSSIDTGGSFNAGGSLFTHDSELVSIIGSNAYSYGPEFGKWVTKPGGGSWSTISSTRIQRNTRSQLSADQATTNGFTCFVWLEPAAPQQGIHVAVYDEVSGTFYQNGSTALASSSGGTSPRVVVVGTTFVILWQDVTAGKIWTNTVSINTPENISAASNIISNLSTNVAGTNLPCMFDAITYNSSRGVCAYVFNNNTSFSVFYFDSTGTVVSTPAAATNFPAAGVVIQSIAVQKDSAGNIYSIYMDTDAGQVKTSVVGLSQSFSISLSKTQVFSNIYSQCATVQNLSSGITCFFYSGGALQANGLYYSVLTISGISTSQTAIPYTGSNPAGGNNPPSMFTDGFIFNGLACIGVVSFTRTGSTVFPTQPTAWVIDTTGAVQARFLSGLAGDEAGAVSGVANNLTNVRLGKILQVNNSSCLLAYERGRLAFNSSVNNGAPIDVTPVGLTRITLTQVLPSKLPVTRVGDTEYIGGAVPRMYDGQQVVEAGIPIPGFTPQLTSQTAGGFLSQGVYQVRSVFSWVDARGQLVRSAPSPALTFTNGFGSSLANITLSGLICDSRDLLPQGATVQIEVYRTTANGTVFYRDSSPSSPIFNPAGGSSAAFVCTQSDTSLQSGEILYTTGGIYDWLAPPPYTASCLFKQRLAIAGLENPYETRVSSPLRKGEALRFNEAWSIFVPTNTGPMVGVAALDDKLILFTTQAAYAVIGDGPDLLGNNPFPSPQLITSVISGAVSPVVANVPDGIIFQDKQGLALLDRGMGCEYFGADVEGYGTWTLRSATVLPAVKQVRFEMDLGSDIPGQPGTLNLSNGGVCLVYDYFYKQWSVFTNYGAQNACIYNGQYTRLRSDGVILQESPTVYTDNGSSYAWVAETAWLKFAGLQGFQRVYYSMLLGNYASDPTGLIWEASYDYSGNNGTPTYATLDKLTLASNAGIYTPGQPFQWERHMRIQKCEAVKFRMTEIPGSSGAGISLTDMTLVVGVKPGQFKNLPPSKRT